MKHVKSIVLLSSLLVLFAGCSATKDTTKETTKKTDQSAVESTVKKDEASNMKDLNEANTLSNLVEPTKKATNLEKKQVKDIKNIQYRVSNENGVMQGVDINFEKNEKIIFVKEKTKENVAIENVSGIAPEDLKTAKIDNKFKEDLFATNFTSWEEKYENKDIQDGTVWEVVVNYKDGTGSVSHGINASPDTFKTFETLALEK